MAEGQEFSFVQFSRMSRPMVRTMEKSRAHRTLNDVPLPKVNWYLSHIFFLRFFKIFLLPHLFFSSLHVRNFQICFLHAGIFLATFFFLQKNTKNSFWVFNPLGKIIWTSFRANFWPCTTFSKNLTVEEAPGRRGALGSPPWGRPTPQVDRPRTNGS